MCSLLQDAWSDSKGHVSLDSKQDYELIEAKQKPDAFYLLFKRPFSTCDPEDYLIEVCEAVNFTVHVPMFQGNVGLLVSECDYKYNLCGPLVIYLFICKRH